MPVYVSDLLTATAAPVNAVPTATRAWQWLRGSTAISGATSSTYTAVTADIGSPIAASQIETNVAGTATATSAPTEVIQAFDPIRLFSASEPGVWYDPNDISTLFKGPASVAPVTSPGDAVYIMADKSQGLALGSNLVVNPDFSTDTWWLKGPGCTIAGGLGVVTAAGDGSGFYKLGFLTVGNYYEITFTVVSISSGGFRISFFGTTNSQTVTVPGTYTVRLVADATSFLIGTVGTTTGTIDDVTVRQVAGNHATQSITASQPIYGIVPAGGRRNLLLQTEAFDTASWTKQTNVTVTANTQTAPNGTLTADTITATTGNEISQVSILTLSGASYAVSLSVRKTTGATVFPMASLICGSATGQVVLNTNSGVASVRAGFPGAANLNVVDQVDYWRLSFSVTSNGTSGGFYFYPAASTDGTSYTGGLSGSQVIWGAQLEQSATATPYQRVTTQYDVTEAGVASLGYLFFDGSGDFMSTGTITPGTDKAQVFTGVRKLNDTVAIVAELSTTLNSNNGSFLFLSGSNNVTGFEFTSKGTISGLGTTGRYAIAAPVTVVFTGIADISAPLSRVRVNGVVGIDGTSTQGTGNFLAYPLFIGRRGGTDFPFSGHIHSLIVRFGPNLTAARISATESWVASKTPGVTL